MVKEPSAPPENPTPPLFWCRICRNVLTLGEASEIDRSIKVYGRVYPSGNCVKCVREFRKVDTDDIVAIHEALEAITDREGRINLRKLTKEQP